MHHDGQDQAKLKAPKQSDRCGEVELLSVID